MSFARTEARSRAGRPVSTVGFSTRHPAFAAVVLAAAMAGCSHWAEIDVGEGWAESRVGMDWMRWSFDARTLYLGPRNGTFDIWTLGRDQTRTRLLTDSCGEPRLVHGDTGDLLFCLVTDPIKPEHSQPRRLTRAAVTDGVLGAPTTLAEEVRHFAVAPRGDAVVFNDAPGDLILLDPSTGRRRELGPGGPVLVGPGGGEVLASTAEGNVLIDVASGARRPLGVPANIGATQWVDGHARVLLLSTGQLVDVATGTVTSLVAGLPQYRSALEATAGPPEAPTEAFFWSERCIDTRRGGEWGNGPEICSENQATLHRVQLASGATDVVAQSDHVGAVAVSDDGNLLASFTSPDNAEGVIHLKHLR